MQDVRMLLGAWQAPDLPLGKHRLLCRDAPLRHRQLGITEGPAGSHRPKPLQQLLTINTHDLLINEARADAMLATDFLAGNPACSELLLLSTGTVGSSSPVLHGLFHLSSLQSLTVPLSARFADQGQPSTWSPSASCHRSN